MLVLKFQQSEKKFIKDFYSAFKNVLLLII